MRPCSSYMFWPSFSCLFLLMGRNMGLSLACQPQFLLQRSLRKLLRTCPLAMFFLSAVFLPPSKTKFPHSASKQRVFSFNIWLEKRPAQPVAALPKAGWRVFRILPLTGGSVCPGAISDLRQQALKALDRLSSPLPPHQAPTILHSGSISAVCFCHSWKVPSTPPYSTSTGLEQGFPE